jgi:hypothetical protein
MPKSENTFFSWFALVLITVTPPWTGGCTQAPSQELKNASKDESSDTIKKPFKFKVNQITELTLGKFDPSTGEHWMTVIKRTDGAAKKRTNSANWEFTSLPDGNDTQDRKANATFIMHLLDSLQALRKVGEAPRGSLSSLGLDPPLFVIRAKTNTDTHEFLMGNLSDDKLGNYLTTNQKDVIIASGSAFKLLPLINSFEYLRDHSWTPFSADDVDELILLNRGKLFFYAQREGTQWNDKNHRPIRFKSKIKPPADSASFPTVYNDTDSILKDLTEIQPSGFIDNPAQVAQIQKSSPKTAIFEAKLIDRHGIQISLQLLKGGKNQEPRLYGLSSSRPSTLLVFDSKLLKVFENAKKSLLPHKRPKIMLITPSVF